MQTNELPSLNPIPPGIENRWELITSYLLTWANRINYGRNGQILNEHSNTEEEILQTEESLGCCFPKLLRNWYQFVGKRRDIIPHWRLLEELHFDDTQKHLNFYGLQHHSVCSIRNSDLENDDPPVYINSERVEDRLTTLMLKMLFIEIKSPSSIWQAVAPSVIDRVMEEVVVTCSQIELSSNYFGENGFLFFQGTNVIIWRNAHFLCLKSFQRDAFRNLFSIPLVNEIGAG